jgi:hypothetical protein
MLPDRRTFLHYSAELTGYSMAALEGTGLVDEYRALVEGDVGPQATALLYATARRALRHRGVKARAHAMQVDVLASPIIWPLSAALIQLWYTGAWTSMSAAWYGLVGLKPPKGVTPGKTVVPSALAYTQQLAFRDAGAHPPGANPTGYGSWSIPPVFGEVAAGERRRPRPAR